jgi:thioredoxin reductase
MFDAAIVGGSYAGISAAMQLARGHRRIAVFDAGRRRNRFASHSHGFLGQDGRPPADIARDAREQLLRYPTVTWIDAAVTAVSGTAGEFVLQDDGDGTHRAARVLLATGVVDHLPDVPGLRERWGRSVFHCPYCHGYELGRRAIGVLATGPMSLHQAQLLPEWGAVTFFLNGAIELTPEQSAELAARGVTVEPVPVRALSGPDAGDVTVELQDGRSVTLAGLFTTSRTEPQGTLAQQLGCEHEDSPVGRFVRTDAMKATSVAGVFACGDAGRAMGNVALAVGDGALAGAGVHRSLVLGLG